MPAFLDIVHTAAEVVVIGAVGVVVVSGWLWMADDLARLAAAVRARLRH